MCTVNTSVQVSARTYLLTSHTFNYIHRRPRATRAPRRTSSRRCRTRGAAASAVRPRVKRAPARSREAAGRPSGAFGAYLHARPPVHPTAQASRRRSTRPPWPRRRRVPRRSTSTPCSTRRRRRSRRRSLARRRRPRCGSVVAPARSFTRTTLAPHGRPWSVFPLP